MSSYIFDNFIKAIDSAVLEFDYPSYYHKRGMNIKNGSNSMLPMNPFPLRDNDFNTSEVKSLMPEIIFSNSSHQILWYLNSVDLGEMSILDSVSYLFAETNKVVRGGINTYKLSGWMVHVLYVYQILTYNIPNGVAPTSFVGSPVDYTFKNLKNTYEGLSCVFKTILRVFGLIHDIGVVDGVQHHDADGGKYVNRILVDLNLTEDFWAGYNARYDDIVLILQVLITNHTLINKVSAEDSDLSIREKCRAINDILSNTSGSFMYDEIATCLYLLGIADLIAVDDSLYTEKKYRLATSSHQFLKSVLKGDPLKRNTEEIALLRLGEMAYEDTYSDLKKETIEILKKQNLDYSKFCTGLYKIFRIEYATAFLKPLRKLEYSVIVLSKMVAFLMDNFGEDRLEKTYIVFDSSIDVKKLKIALDNHEFDYIISKMNRDILMEKSNNLVIIYDPHNNALILSTVVE